MQSVCNGPHPKYARKAAARRLTRLKVQGTLHVVLLRPVLTNNRKVRTYFDSGEHALSAADRVTDNGARTGKAHPHRDSISHPYAPILAASNVKKDAIEDAYRKSTSPE
ncbi:unnamed protein product [Penicillium pancosmium]